MSKKCAPSTYSVTARLVIISSIDVAAKSFEEALEKAKTLKEQDFVTIDGDHIDSSIRLSNISANGTWKTDDH